jgi:ribose 5-phosphate isomerase B
MRIFIGADHRGFKVKELIRNYLVRKGYTVVDVGNHEYDINDDYPHFARKVAQGVAEDFDENRGIVLCGSGVGVNIVANKQRGIRCFIPLSPEHASAARHDDDVNMIALGPDFMRFDDMKGILDVWLETEFSGEERHKRRIDAIDEME